METALLTVGAPWLLYNMAKGLIQAVTRNNPQFQPHDKIEVKYRGKTFQQITTGQEADLSLKAVIPYMIPIGIVGIDVVLLFLRGAKHELRRGAPTERLRMYVMFAVFPLIDLIAGEDWTNPTNKQEHTRKSARRHFRFPLYLWCLIELLATLGSFREMLDFKNGLKWHHRASLFIKLGMANGAFGINVSHELLHKNNWVERALAYALLVNVNYTHWQDEHEYGHHTHVATPLDPATAKQGVSIYPPPPRTRLTFYIQQTLYSFLPQSFLGTWRSACGAERNRLLQAGKPWYCKENQVLRGVVMSFCWSLVLAKYTNSLLAVPLFYAQGTLSALLLEVINYIEHYGLERKPMLPQEEEGEVRYEPVDPTHSWNAPHAFSNAILFKLQRHSDHHTFPTRSYELLRNFAESPQLPCGYVGMLVLAFCPPAFFYVMQPLLEAHKIESSARSHGRHASSSEREGEVVQLKLCSRRRIWAWTLGTLTCGGAWLAAQK